MDFATWKQKQLDNYKRMQMPAPTDQELQAKYDATQSLKSSLAQSAVQHKIDKAKFQQGMDEQRKSLIETGYGKFPESEPTKSPLQEAISRKVDPVGGIGPVASGEEYAKNLPNSLDSITKSEKPPVTNTKPEKPATPPQKPAEVKQEAKQSLAAVMQNENIPDTRREEAYSQFSEARTRNEWLDVAQTLAKALAQYGAATSGRAQSGRDMTLPNMPSVDYTGRTATSERELERRIRDFDTEDAAKRDLAKEDKAEKRFQEQLKYNRERDTKEFAYRDKKAAEDANKLDPLDRLAIQQNYSQQSKQLEDAQKEAKAGLHVVNNLLTEGKLDAKSLKARLNKDPQLLANANIDANTIKQLQGQLKEYPGTIYSTAAEKAEVDQYNADLLKNAIVKPAQERITNITASIQSQLDAYKNKKSTGQQQSQPARIEQQPPSGKQDPRIVEYAKQYNLDYAKAREVLVKRNYTPQE